MTAKETLLACAPAPLRHTPILQERARGRRRAPRSCSRTRWSASGSPVRPPTAGPCSRSRAGHPARSAAGPLFPERSCRCRLLATRAERPATVYQGTERGSAVKFPAMTTRLTHPEPVMILNLVLNPTITLTLDSPPVHGRRSCSPVPAAPAALPAPWPAASCRSRRRRRCRLRRTARSSSCTAASPATTTSRTAAAPTASPTARCSQARDKLVCPRPVQRRHTVLQSHSYHGACRAPNVGVSNNNSVLTSSPPMRIAYSNTMRAGLVVTQCTTQNTRRCVDSRAGSAVTFTGSS